MPAPARVGDVVKYKGVGGTEGPGFVLVVLPSDVCDLVVIRVTDGGTPGLYHLKNVPYGSSENRWRWLNE